MWRIIRMSTSHAFKDERSIRARKIMQTARANLAGHRDRDARVADVLAAARRTAARLDPQRAAREKLHQQAVVLRQQRARRILDVARSTIERLSPVQEHSRANEI